MQGVPAVWRRLPGSGSSGRLVPQAGLTTNDFGPIGNLMQVSVNQRLVELVTGDITRQEVDAIVNAANRRLAGGGGVDGAIHRAGGPAIMRETREKYPDGCPTGSAVLSGAGNLAARFIFHAVGPVWHDGESGEPQLLTTAYRRCLELAREQACRSIAFPAISTGVYGYPQPLAAQASLAEIIRFLLSLPGDESQPVVVTSSATTVQQPLGLTRMVLFAERDYDVFAEVLRGLVAA